MGIRAEAAPTQPASRGQLSKGQLPDPEACLSPIWSRDISGLGSSLDPENCSWTNIPYAGKVAQASGIGLKGTACSQCPAGLGGPSRVHTSASQTPVPEPQCLPKENTLILSCQGQRGPGGLTLDWAVAEVLRAGSPDLTPRPQWK